MNGYIRIEAKPNFEKIDVISILNDTLASQGLSFSQFSQNIMNLIVQQNIFGVSQNNNNATASITNMKQNLFSKSGNSKNNNIENISH